MIRIPQPRSASVERVEEAPADTEPQAEVVAEQPIRQGSPFADGSTATSGVRQLDPSHLNSLVSRGPMQYTAVGALVSCAVVVGFAIPAAVWFPPGGVMISILGVLLAVFSLQSRRVKVSLFLLAVQLVLFLYCVSAIYT